MEVPSGGLVDHRVHGLYLGPLGVGQGGGLDVERGSGVTMPEHVGERSIFGIDSHVRTTAICANVVENGETVKRTFCNNPNSEHGWDGRERSF